MARLLRVLSHRFTIDGFVRTGKILGITWYVCRVPVKLSSSFRSGRPIEKTRTKNCTFYRIIIKKTL
jgi:hypothetical protein